MWRLESFIGKIMLNKSWISMRMTKFTRLRLLAQRDWNGAEIAVTMATEAQKYTRSSGMKENSYPQRPQAIKDTQASKTGSQNQPRGAKITTWRQTLES